MGTHTTDFERGRSALWIYALAGEGLPSLTAQRDRLYDFAERRGFHARQSIRVADSVVVAPHGVCLSANLLVRLRRYDHVAMCQETYEFLDATWREWLMRMQTLLLCTVWLVDEGLEGKQAPRWERTGRGL